MISMSSDMSEKSEFLTSFVDDLLERASALGFTGEFDEETHLFSAYAADGEFICSFKVDVADNEDAWVQDAIQSVDQDVPEGAVVH
ncbi:MAG TPA: hypothetical protein EYO59_10050 [Chromatiaceae bacterium]|nr:hypothetical protein [Chromatiaceae bacterium]